jgi:BirA family biotin operon repressor/biotin-[acetyl-CoA-carboxylase] ligase
LKQNTLHINHFVGKVYTLVDETGSTNILAAELLSKGEADAGTVVIAKHQTHGRGQMGSGWESDPSMNITMSVVLKPDFLAVDRQFEINKAICLGIKDFLEPVVQQEVQVKWPNDILVNGKKIAGILTVNIVQGSGIISTIVGIGLNVNQLKFNDAPNAVSIHSLIGRKTDVNTAISDLCKALDARYERLAAKAFEELSDDYLQSLYRFGQESTFQAGDEEFKGSIRGISPIGKLIVEKNSELLEFGMKEIEFLPEST